MLQTIISDPLMVCLSQNFTTIFMSFFEATFFWQTGVFETTSPMKLFKFCSHRNK